VVNVVSSRRRYSEDVRSEGPACECDAGSVNSDIAAVHLALAAGWLGLRARHVTDAAKPTGTRDADPSEHGHSTCSVIEVSHSRRNRCVNDHRGLFG
jgi:hypothetical protein